MATQKEIEALNQLVSAAIKVNASSERVDVTVEVNRGRVHVRISDPVVVLANCEDGSVWDWLFYDRKSAYFSDDIFTEEAFLERCQEFIGIVNGFEGYAVQEGK